MERLRFPRWQLDDTDPVTRLREQGFARIGAAHLAGLAGCEAAALDRLLAYWDDLPADEHLRDGGRYRQRRHASLRLGDPQAPFMVAPRRPHWQPLDYNALHGGYERWFVASAEAFLDDPALRALVLGLHRLLVKASGKALGFVELHQFRITTADGIGRPTPEGAHRDGVDFVVVLMLRRHQVRGGETRVFEAEGPAGVRFVLDEPWSALLLDDARVIHESTPVQPDGTDGFRDTLVLTFRDEGFLDPV